MTLTSLLNVESPSVHSIFNERGEHYSPAWKGGGGWKKEKGNTQSALSALTLLAFLFFLNMLQNCLRDQMQNQAPIVVMMTTMTTTTTTDAQRLKRSLENLKGDYNLGQNNSNFEDYKIFVDGLGNATDTNYFEKIYDSLCCNECDPWKAEKGEIHTQLRKSLKEFCQLLEQDRKKENCENEHCDRT